MYLLGPSERAGTLLAFWWLCLNWPGPADTHQTSKFKVEPFPLDWTLCLLKPEGPVAQPGGAWSVDGLLALSSTPDHGPRPTERLTPW